MKKKRDEVHFINFITRDRSSTVYEKETDERQYYNFSSTAACCRSSRKKKMGMIGNDCILFRMHYFTNECK